MDHNFGLIKSRLCTHLREIIPPQRGRTLDPEINHFSVHSEIPMWQETRANAAAKAVEGIAVK